MKTFLIKVGFFSSLCAIIILFGVLIPDKSTTQSLHYSIFDKHKLLQESPSPRLIFVGGSNVSFGIYSPLFRDSLDVNPINTAIHAGYGLKYIIDDISPYIKQNDIVILSPEYSHFFGNTLYGSEALLQSIDVYSENVNLLNFKQWLRIVKYVPKNSLGKIKTFILSFIDNSKDETGIYERNSYNKYGDVVTTWEKPNQEVSSTLINGDYNKKTIKIILKFSNLIQSKGGKLYFTYPSFLEDSFDLNKQKIEKVEAVISKTNIPTLGTPKQYFFSKHLFFNTQYHLNKKGQSLRSQKLIEQLKESGY